MPPARALLVAASFAGFGFMGRALVLGPPPLPLALGVLVAYLALVAWGITYGRYSMFGDVVTSGPTAARGVALTFNGPLDPATTLRLLERLATAGIRATFFVGEDAATAHRDLVRAIVAGEHSLGLELQPRGLRGAFEGRARVRRQLDEGLRALEATTGAKVRLVSTPSGAVTPALAAAARHDGVWLVGWSVAATCGRAERAAVEATAQRVNRGLRDGAIVRLSIDGGAAGGAAARVDALEAILDAAARLQLPFVGLDRWLEGD